MLNIDVEHAPDGARVTLSGELDLAVEHLVRAAFGETAGARRVEIDLKELTYLDSTGLNLLVRARTAAAGEGRSFYIVNANGFPAKVLAVAGLLDLLSDPTP